MTNWKISHSTEYPELIDTTSSNTTVYIRRNVQKIESEDSMDGEPAIMYEYEEKQMSKEEYTAYADLIEVSENEAQNKADIDYIAMMAGVEL